MEPYISARHANMTAHGHTWVMMEIPRPREDATGFTIHVPPFCRKVATDDRNQNTHRGGKSYNERPKSLEKQGKSDVQQKLAYSFGRTNVLGMILKRLMPCCHGNTSESRTSGIDRGCCHGYLTVLHSLHVCTQFVLPGQL